MVETKIINKFGLHDLKSKIFGWVKDNRREAVILGLIILVGAFLRLFKIADYMTFLGDEGRDAIIVRRLLVNFDPILIGPGTSVGNMYLGPLYYYMMAPALLLSNFSPVGPSIMVALLGVLTIFFIWYIAKLWFGNIAAVISSLLYALSPVVIIYSKSSWNPNIMPFFALLCIYALWKAFYELNYKWLIVLGISYAFVLQSHYLGLLLAPTIFLFWVLAIIKIKNYRTEIVNFTKNSLIGLLFFVFLMSPLVIFDARHGWRNFSAIWSFFYQRETTVSIKPWKAIPNIWPILRDDFITRIVAAKSVWIGKYLSAALSFTIGVYLLTNINKLKYLWRNFGKNGYNDKYISGFILIFVWIFIGLTGLSLYKQHIYDHYFGFIFPAPFLLVGAISQKVWDKYSFDGKILVTFITVILIGADIIGDPLRNPANFQMQRAKDVAKIIQNESDGNKFNLAVIAERNYEDGYQYFLEEGGAPVYDIDPLNLQNTIADQLFVVCELSEAKCDPTHSPNASIANFGWSKIDRIWKTNGVVIYKLVHSTS